VAGQNHFLESFARHGIGSGRLEFAFARRVRQEYLRFYHQVDIGLDPLPYTGHTTSCDSFWMGVPVITLAGQTSVSPIRRQPGTTG
jgi:predicted O-linked N-acetylglucosamine transferase (SPINDLY family)